MRLIFGLLCLLWFSVETAAQHYVPLGDFATNKAAAAMYEQGATFSSIKPYRYNEVHSVDSSFELGKKWSVYPVLDVGFGSEFNSAGSQGVQRSIFGIGVHNPSNSPWIFEINGYAGYFDVPTFAKGEVENLNAIKTGGYARPNGAGYDTYQFTGNVGRSLGKYVTAEIGRGKHFFGDGHRSLLLSDDGMPYSYGKLTTQVWRLKYVNLYTALDDISSASPRDWGSYGRKYAAMHYLSWNATDWLDISLFEAVVWRAQDTLIDRGFDPAYINPIIFYRPVEYYGGSADNSLLGLNILIKPGGRWGIYGQVMLDEFLLSEVRKDVSHLLGRNNTEWGWWANKQAFQLGVRKHGIGKSQAWNFLTEVNMVRPFMYTHVTKLENYGHFNLPLAHPAGANFYEWVGKVWWAQDQHFAEAAVVALSQGLDTPTDNYGSNINTPYFERNEEYGYFIGRGAKRTFWNFQLRYAYNFHKHGNLNGFILLQQRLESIQGAVSNSTFVQLGLRSQLFRGYYDY